VTRWLRGGTGERRRSTAIRPIRQRLVHSYEAIGYVTVALLPGLLLEVTVQLFDTGRGSRSATLFSERLYATYPHMPRLALVL
jgi:hypothetical protein